jgi:transcriptional regulator with XRE-family HTH domain
VPSHAVSRIETARRRAGLTQAELADRAGLCRETISRLERGEEPMLGTALAVANALGTGLDVFTSDPSKDDAVA